MTAYHFMPAWSPFISYFTCLQPSAFGTTLPQTLPLFLLPAGSPPDAKGLLLPARTLALAQSELVRCKSGVRLEQSLHFRYLDTPGFMC